MRYRYVFERYLGAHREKSLWAFITWNWPAAIFGCFWFAYRKMYGWAAFAFFIEGYLPFKLGKWGIIADGSGLDWAMMVLPMLIFGMYANGIYIDHTKENVCKAESRAHLAVLGGTSVIAVFGTIAIGLALYAIELQALK